MPQARSSGERIEIVLVLGAIAFVGLLAAPLPFTGDQALFASGARQIADGAVLYKDFWDVKQPGIYLFSLTGGKLFGYSEVGLHLDLYLSGRPQAVAINGWSPEQYPESVWERLRHELEEASPKLLVVDRFSDAIMRDRSPATLRLIADRYRPVGRAGPDRWYELRPTAPVVR